MSAKTGIGRHVLRKEDFRLLTGQGKFSDDVSLDGQCHAYILRSPHAHALINGIDVTAALTTPGVLTVLTNKDYEADGLAPIPPAQIGRAHV